MAWTDSHQCGWLIQGHVLYQQAVENLESGLFFGSQSRILHQRTVTLYLWVYGIIPWLERFAGAARRCDIGRKMPSEARVATLVPL